MIEFNKETLKEWKAQGVGFLVTEEINSSAEIEPDVAKFIIYPLKTAPETEDFILHKTRGMPYAIQHGIICYDIKSIEATEISEGLFACKFYIYEKPATTLQPQAPHRIYL